MKNKLEPTPSTTPSTVSSRRLSRLLVAVDDSEPAGHALDFAVQLALQFNADVWIIHTFSAMYLIHPEVDFNITQVRGELVTGGNRLLQNARAKFPTTMRVQTLLREGDPATEILRAATEEKIDLIVMGTHARSRLAQTVLGSVAREVTRLAPCPVLTLAHAPRPRGANRVVNQDEETTADHSVPMI